MFETKSFNSTDADLFSVASSAADQPPAKQGGFFHRFAKTFVAQGPGQSRQDRRKNEAIQSAKDKLLNKLAKAHGDVQDKSFIKSLDKLVDLYDPSHFDARVRTNKKKDASSHLGGTWMALSKPTFSGCIGRNMNDDPMYTLGQMSFDMFRPGKLACSIQGCFNPVHTVSRKNREAIKFVPKSLKDEVLQGSTVLRSYDIVTALTIESNSEPLAKDLANKSIKKPVKGLMTMHGYILPDPEQPNRLISWFTGGTLEMDDPNQTLKAWKQIFDGLGRRELQAQARVLAAWLAMGAEPAQKMDEDGKMRFSFQRPMDGCYLDVLYMDESLRVMKAKSGTVFVFARDGSCLM